MSRSDRHRNRRRILLAQSLRAFYLFISLSGIALYFYPKIWALTIVGLLGVLSTDASDNGPATTLEQTMLTERFHPGPSSLGNLFFITSVINAGSLFITPLISKRVGIVQTMIGTHLVSNLLLTIAGLLQNVSLGAPLIAAALLKLVYGVATWDWAKRYHVLKKPGHR